MKTAATWTVHLTLSAITYAQSTSPIGIVETSLVYLPASRPVWAQKLSPYLAAMSIEMDHWPDWAGGQVGTPNTFLNTVLGNLKQRTGKGTWFRVGADSEDRALLNLSVPVFSIVPGTVTPTVPYPEASEVFIGRDFYALSQNLPAGTQFTWGLNLRSLNMTETVAQAAHLADTFQGSRGTELAKAQVSLRLVELGNEPDLYSKTAVPNIVNYQTWTPLNYSQTWNTYARAVMNVMDFSGNLKFQTAAFAGGETWRQFSAISALETGLLSLDEDVAKATSTYADHFYNAVFASGYMDQPGQLMAKQPVRQNATLRLNDVRAATQSGLDFVWGETNSYANHGSPGTSNTAESAIWGIDWMLQSASHGISRTHFHNGYGYRYNVIQPFTGLDDGTNTTDRPHIMPLYHAFLVVNEAIGTSGKSWVTELGTTNNTVGQTGTQLGAYGIWEGKNLARLVFINAEQFSPGNATSTPRNQLQVVLQGNSATKQATVKYLHTPSTTTFHGLSWAGQDFDTDSGIPSGSIVEVPVVNGSFMLEASSVALVSFST